MKTLIKNDFDTFLDKINFNNFLTKNDDQFLIKIDFELSLTKVDFDRSFDQN